MKSTLKLVAAHEIAHVMGLGEMYLIPTLQNHDYQTQTWECVMRRFAYPDKGAEFVNSIEEANSSVSAFCDHCKALLSKSISTRYFPAYTPAP